MVLMGYFDLGASLCRLHESSIFGVRAVLGMEPPCLSSGYAGHCPLDRGSGWYCSDHSPPLMLGGAFSLLCACHSPVGYKVFSPVIIVEAPR